MTEIPEIPTLTAREHLYGRLAFVLAQPLIWVPIFLFCPWH